MYFTEASNYVMQMWENNFNIGAFLPAYPFTRNSLQKVNQSKYIKNDEKLTKLENLQE